MPFFVSFLHENNFFHYLSFSNLNLFDLSAGFGDSGSSISGRYFEAASSNAKLLCLLWLRA